MAAEKWNLSSEALEQLLLRLDPDRRTAALEYETLRRKLVDFFDWRGAAAPDRMADETLDRVARRLAQGEVVDHIRGYVHGVARRVLQEAHKRTSRERAALASLEREGEAAEPAEAADDRLPCLRLCLRQLSERDRALIMDYYDGEGIVHLSERKALADRLAIPYGTLKTRAHRLRNVLQDCTGRCLEGQSA